MDMLKEKGNFSVGYLAADSCLLKAIGVCRSFSINVFLLCRLLPVEELQIVGKLPLLCLTMIASIGRSQECDSCIDSHGTGVRGSDVFLLLLLS